MGRGSKTLLTRVATILVMTLLNHHSVVMDLQLCSMVLVFPKSLRKKDARSLAKMTMYVAVELKHASFFSVKLVDPGETLIYRKILAMAMIYQKKIKQNFEIPV